MVAKYSVNQHPVQTLLTWVQSEEIAIPEIQRPFVWNKTQVRDFIDSLYQGYPVGYLIAWRNPAVKLKDGATSEGKRILIDGQQRVTALLTSILGEPIVDKNYSRTKLKIAFHPQEEKFEVTNPAIEKDKSWLSDISSVLSGDVKILKLVSDYCEKNGIENEEEIYENIERLRQLRNNQIGLIELNSDLDIETVTDIFIRINSKGTELSQADFAMSKIASNESYGGNQLRKIIDYFCHLVVAPEYFEQIEENDVEFSSSPWFQKISWLKNQNDDLYEPSYSDLLRVAFTSNFKRGRLRDLVALLSGRNFETREFEAEIAEDSFNRLYDGVSEFINETNFKRLLMILRSAGLIDASLIRSKSPLNFAYVIYLISRAENIPAAEIESLVRRWYVMSILTERYSGNPEGAYDYDIKRIQQYGIKEYLERIEDANMSEAFWRAGLPQKLNSSVASSPFFRMYQAAQVKMQDKGFLSKSISVSELIQHKGDIHHFFPKEYLKKRGYTRGQYNQIANYVIMQSEINIAIGKKSPVTYIAELNQQCNGGELKYGGIRDEQELQSNFEMHCLPYDSDLWKEENYQDFLEERRKAMAGKLKRYYESL